MVANGELRYVMYGGDRGGKQDIANWLSASCSVVQEFSQLSTGGPQMPQGENQPQGLGGGGSDQGATLYLCR